MKIERIRINGLREPLGFALPWLEASWYVTETESKKAVNTVLELLDENGSLICRKEGGDLNHAGETLDAVLRPRTGYTLRVGVSGDAGDSAAGECPFETGKMDEPWAAEWIGPRAGDGCHPLLRRGLTVRPGLRRARLYACGLGMFEAYVNGEKLGDEYLKPGLTDYNTRLQVVTFPVEGLKEGENELSILLGKGWYMSMFGLALKENNFGDRMAAIAELHLDYADGSHEVIGTDADWSYRASQITDSGIYYGEDLDRSRPLGEEGPVEVLSPDTEGTRNLRKERLTDRLSLPLRVQEVLPVKEILRTPAGETVLDFGQNFAGIPEFDAALPAGTVVTLDFGEILQKGNFYNKNYRDARDRFIYTSGGLRETVRPHFTFFGFRYVRVTGWTGELRPEMFRGLVLFSDMERSGTIETGNAKINRLYENTVWGLRSNFLDIPTDCPQRSERLGWTGDAQVFAPTASYHYDTKAFYRKFVRDLMDEQVKLDGGVPNYFPNMEWGGASCTSAWGDVGTFLPATVWRAFGSKAELEFAWPLMRGWVDYMDRQDTERRHTFEPPFQFGDWLGLDGASETSYKGGTEDALLGALYYHQSAKLTAQAAEALGKTEEAAHYRELSEQIRQYVLDEYFTPNGRFAPDTQAAYIAALKFGLWRDHDRLMKQFLDRLKKDNYRIRCGFVGAPLLCTVLAENGRTDLAYDFLFQEGFPSWLYAVNLGATTIWERWNSVQPDGTIEDNEMNSLNHYSYGSVMEFVYAWAAGLRCAEPGWRKAIIAPQPDRRLGRLNCAYESAAGRYVSKTRINADGTLDVHVEVPFGCEAELRLPRSGKPAETLRAGVYDYHYMPERDYRKPYGTATPLTQMANSPAAMEILDRLVPALAAIARGQNPDFGAATMEEVGGMFFLGIDPAKLAQAVKEIQEVIEF